jgi:hypothetical protein
VDDDDDDDEECIPLPRTLPPSGIYYIVAIGLTRFLSASFLPQLFRDTVVAFIFGSVQIVISLNQHNGFLNSMY